MTAYSVVCEDYTVTLYRTARGAAKDCIEPGFVIDRDPESVATLASITRALRDNRRVVVGPPDSDWTYRIGKHKRLKS